MLHANSNLILQYYVFLIQGACFKIEQTKERTKERTNQRTNEHMNEGKKKQTHTQMNKNE